MATSKISTGKISTAITAKGTGRLKRTRKGKTPRTPRTHKPKDLSLEAWQIRLRREFGREQKFLLENLGQEPFFSEFLVTNPGTGGTYRVAIRGARPGDNYCSCPDFSVNTLGTCKHVEFTLARLMKRRGARAAFREGFQPPFSEVYLRYGAQREVAFRPAAKAPEWVRALAARFFDERGILKPSAFGTIEAFLKDASKGGIEVRFYEDAVQFVAQVRDDAARRWRIQRAFPGGAGSPAFEGLLKTPLYPYQREGALFAALAGRSLIADDMGLGKTVEALAAVEILARHAGAGRVLVICPTSLKHQWHEEIERFTERPVLPVQGTLAARAACYEADSFYKITSYDVICRDAEAIARWAPDVIILDEAQRIKNWRTRTAQSVKRLASPYAVVLTGTPLENRLEELHSIVEFVDRFRLGPLYRFVHAHRLTDQGGKVIGYKDLDKIRASLGGVMIRRRKSEVLKQLPERIDKNFFVPMTPEQMAIHQDYADIVAQLVNKWRRFKFLSDADSLRLRIALANMRMVADNTWLVDKKTVHGPKIGELETLLRELVIEGGEKIVIFSQWLRMNGLVEEVLERLDIGHVHLNGSVPSKERKHLMSRFKSDPACKVFLSTDAGGVGLNLQSGSTVINLDIPWNPAILEQRIARVHRMGQKKPVRVINFISRNSIEERILDLLRFKKAVFAGALEEDGRDTVMLGESQIESFMNSVEDLTGGMEQADLSGGQAIWRDGQEAEEAGDELVADVSGAGEDEAAEMSAPAAASTGAALQTPQLGELLQTGARFLMELGQTLAPQPPSGEAGAAPAGGDVPRNPLASLVSVDEATGKSCLKIPLPEPEVMNSIVSGLNQLLAGFMAGRTPG